MLAFGLGKEKFMRKRWKALLLVLFYTVFNLKSLVVDITDRFFDYHNDYDMHTGRIESKTDNENEYFETLQYSNGAINSEIMFNYSITSVKHVYHVTKEFGPASMGGLGTVVTQLAMLQNLENTQSNERNENIENTQSNERNGNIENTQITQRNGNTQNTQRNVSVILPFYTFLKERVENITLNSIVTLNIGKIYCPFLNVYCKLKTAFSSRVTARIYNAIDPQTKVPLVLISPGDIYPFTDAFRADNVLEMYLRKGLSLSNNLKDLYFAFVTIAFLKRQSHVVAHLHGATNGIIAAFKPCKTIYTLHDDSFEFDYKLKEHEINLFISKNSQSISSHFRFYHPSLSGIRFATNLTCVSTETSISLKSKDNPNRYLKHLESIVHNPHLLFQRMTVVRNGLLINHPINKRTSINPFDNEQLLRVNLTFQRRFYDMPKLKCKKHLASIGVIPFNVENDDIWILFIGRYTVEKGVEYFKPLIQGMKSYPNMKFIMMGQSHITFDIRNIEKLQNENVYLVSSNVQKNYGVIIRAASDVAFVPSLTESFGLVAAEGLLFGQLVLSTAQGGLSHFLSPFLSSKASSSRQIKFKTHIDVCLINQCTNRWISFGNALIFSNSTELLSKVSNLSMIKWNNMMRWSFVLDAYSLSWHKGPLNLYNNLYYSVVTTL
jgi:glycogen synthase